MSREDVWITGMGASTPVGDNFDAISANLLGGRSGIRAVEEFPVADHPSRIAGRVDRIPCPAGWRPEEFAARRPLERLVLWCCAEALRDSGLGDRREAARVGLVLGLGAEWLITWEGQALEAGSAQPWRPDGLVESTRMELGLDGPTLGLSAACASGNHALAVARQWLKLGWADVCLAGACEMAVTPMSMGCFGNLRALSRRNDDPRSASRPFDSSRDGFVIGEGGAAFVLEPAPAAGERGARAYASVVGFGSSSDAHHAVIPSPDPGPAASAMRQALAEARVEPDEVDYVNAHAPGTPVGDILEANALAIVLGESTARVPVSSTKSMTGHLLTAAGAIEAIACMAALEHQALPPTTNLDDPDPRCALNHVANQARPQPVEVVVSNSFGFGGSNTCLVLRAMGLIHPRTIHIVARSASFPPEAKNARISRSSPTPSAAPSIFATPRLRKRPDDLGHPLLGQPRRLATASHLSAKPDHPHVDDLTLHVVEPEPVRRRRRRSHIPSPPARPFLPRPSHTPYRAS